MPYGTLPAGPFILHDQLKARLDPFFGKDAPVVLPAFKVANDKNLQISLTDRDAKENVLLSNFEINQQLLNVSCSGFVYSVNFFYFV